MPLRYSLFLLLTLGLCSAARAQQPFARFGVKVEVLSLSNGRYPEFFPNDSLRRVGSVVYNRRLHRIAYLLPPDSLLGRAKSEVTSRWWVVDPHAENYANITPYAYVANNPVNHTDPDGRDIHYNAGKGTRNAKKGVTTIVVTVDVSVKVLNQSNLPDSEFASRAADFKQNLSSSLSGSYNIAQTKTNFVFKAGKIDVQVAGSMKDVKSSDHLMVMVDDVTGTTKDKNGRVSDRGGVAELNGKIGYVQSSEGGESMTHEFGHNMGLLHNWESSPKDDDGNANHMGYNANQNEFSGGQLYRSMTSTLNQGSNSSTMGAPGMARDRTTNQTPYKRAADQERVPKPLN